MPGPSSQTVVPDAIGVGTYETVGGGRYALLRLTVADGQLDIVISWSDLGALSAEIDELRSREVAR